MKVHLVITLASALTNLAVNSAASANENPLLHHEFVVPRTVDDVEKSSSIYDTFIRLLTPLFTPEGHKMLDQMDKMPRGGRRSYLSLRKDRNGRLNQDALCDAINALPISDDEEDQYDDGEFDYFKTPHQENVIEVKCYGVNDDKMEGNYSSIIYRLNDARIRVAIFSGLFRRFKELVSKKKLFRTVNSVDKREMFQLALTALHDSKYCFSSFKNFEMLLKFGFSVEFSANLFSQVSSPIPGFSYIQTIIKDDKTAKAILRHDKNFFRRLDDSHNYIEDFIRNEEYDVAMKALKYGLDPSISTYGVNALEAAIEMSVLLKNRKNELIKNLPPPKVLILDEEDQEREREKYGNYTQLIKTEKTKTLFKLIETLKKDYGLIESELFFTYANFQKACKEKNFDLARMILNSLKFTPGPSSEEYSDLSPLESALRTDNIKLIQKVSDLLLTKLDEKQLQSCLSNFRIKYFQPEPSKEVIIFKNNTLRSIRKRLDEIKNEKVKVNSIIQSNNP